VETVFFTVILNTLVDCHSPSLHICHSGCQKTGCWLLTDRCPQFCLSIFKTLSPLDSAENL